MPITAFLVTCTFLELGRQSGVPSWHSLWAEDGTIFLSDALNKALSQPEVRERFAAQGLDVATSTPEQLNAHIRAEVAKWTRIARTANIKVE